MKFFTKEVKIALVAIIGIVVLFFGMNFLKGLSLFSSSSIYYVKFSNVSGLSVSSPVFANGFKVGVVEGIDYNYADPSQIVVAIGLDKKLSMPRGTTAEISSDLLGNVKLELSFGADAADRLTPGDTITGGQKTGLMDKAADVVPQIEQMLPKLDSILLQVNTLLADPALPGTLHNAEALTAQLTATSQNLHQLTGSLNRRVPGMLDKASATLDHVESLTAQMSQIDIDKMAERVNTTLENVQQLSAALRSDQGTLGLLMRDPQLYHRLTETMRDVDALLVDFKAHPRRYINVSVFGKKSE